MGGVDLFDQLIQYYPFTRRSKRWTAKLNKYLLQLAFQNAYVLYLEYSTDRPKLSHSRFLEAAGDGLVNFNPDDWPSMTGPIPRAGDLPLDERADRDRTVNPPPARRRRDSEDTSEDEEMVDEPDVPRSPLLMPPPATPAATSTPAAAPQDVPAAAAPEDVPAAAAPEDVPAAAPDAALPVPDPPGDQRAATFRPSQWISDPVDRLHHGDHTLVNIAEAGGEAKQKRCRVCQKNGRRRDTRFMCRCVGLMRNVTANTTPWRFTGVRRPEGQGGAQPGARSKGGSLPPPPAPRRAQKNKMQDSSMEEGENNTEESGLW